MEVLDASLVASGATIATVALRRVDPSVPGSIYDLLKRRNFTLLPNTAGCFSASEAVKVAELAREAFDTNVIKLEVIGDDVTLLPDTAETLIAADQLVRKGFEVWAYTSDDPARIAHRLGARYPQSSRHLADRRADRRGGPARRRRGHGFGRCARNGVGL